MSRTDRSKDRFKQPKVFKPASSKRQKYKNEIEEELLEYKEETNGRGDVDGYAKK